jgi:murein DD-endopeptidase MepM/ murein hydrolase activator NlpD
VPPLTAPPLVRVMATCVVLLLPSAGAEDDTQAPGPARSGHSLSSGSVGGPEGAGVAPEGWVTPAHLAAQTVAGGLRAASRPHDDSRWSWPVRGSEVVIRPFDAPARRWLPGHRGVDLGVGDLRSVRAVADGSVRFSGRVAGVGVVSVAHAGGLISTYQPVQASVRPGERVSRGQVLGVLRAAGSHCMPSRCLHLGARQDDAYIDPMLLLRPWEVSLLPQAAREVRGRPAVTPVRSA